MPDCWGIVWGGCSGLVAMACSLTALACLLGWCVRVLCTCLVGWLMPVDACTMPVSACPAVTALLGPLLLSLITLCCCISGLLLLLWPQVGKCAASDQLNLRHAEAPAAAVATHKVLQTTLARRHGQDTKIALEPAAQAVQLARVANQQLLCRVGRAAGLCLAWAARCCRLFLHLKDKCLQGRCELPWHAPLLS